MCRVQSWAFDVLLSDRASAGSFDCATKEPSVSAEEAVSSSRGTGIPACGASGRRLLSLAGKMPAGPTAGTAVPRTAP